MAAKVGSDDVKLDSGLVMSRSIFVACPLETACSCRTSGLFTSRGAAK